MPLDQSQTPLASRLLHCAQRPNAAFHTPGHKRGQGISDRHRALFGDAVFKADLPELPDLDNLFAPEGVILQAQQLAAAAFGAEQTWLLANGSTCGIEAAILATCGPGEKLILPRNVHSSAISGMVLSGAVPVYVQPEYSAEWDLALGVSPEAIEAALVAHPDAKAVLVVSPTYHGICSNLDAIARITHRHHCPLIVDEAHAPHFAFHPGFPPTALSAGADIAIQSAHKVLSAFTQSALLHVQAGRCDRHQLAKALQLTQSTSPSYLLLGSLDAARHQMATAGTALMTQTLTRADRAVKSLEKLPGLKLLNLANPRDKTRITVDVTALGLTGFAADEILCEQFGVTAELPSLRHLMFLVTLGNTAADIDQLVKGFQALCKMRQEMRESATSTSTSTSTGIADYMQPAESLNSQLGISPRQAFFAPAVTCAIAQSVGQLAAETLCPYPPGIPLLLPGEPITAGAIAQLQRIQAAGGTLTGCQDPTLQTIQVIKQ